MITALPLFLILHCNFIFLFKRWLGPLGTFYTSVLALNLCSGLVMYELYYIFETNTFSFCDNGRWFFCVDLIDAHLVFCFDPLALICTFVVTSLTCAASYFGVEYMYREAFINRLLYLLNLFAASVIFLFISYDLFLIIVAWEGIGLFSLLLVNFYSMRIYTIKAALKTFIFSRVSDMFMMCALIFLLLLFHTTDLSLIFIQLPFYMFHYFYFGYYAVHFLSLIAITLAISGLIKAAQFFFHVWLPDAMEAPTPASALIHSSTLVIAGVFLILRFSLLFEFVSGVNYCLAVLGATTLIFAAITAIFQNDIKKLVAYSTISQIGYLVCGCGFCCYEEVLLYLIIHAFNKAFLFILVGYLVHFFSGNTDMRYMGGGGIYSFDIAVLLFGISLNLMGLPYSAGFIGKEFLLFQLWKEDFIVFYICACWIMSFFFTPAYMGLLIFIVLYSAKKAPVSVFSPFWYFNNWFFSRNANKTRPLQIAVTQISPITARTTSILLFIAWILFFSLGEQLLAILLDLYSSGLTLIPRFFLITHAFETAWTITSITSVWYLNYYLKLFFIWAFLWLINLKQLNNYNFLTFFTPCLFVSMFIYL